MMKVELSFVPNSIASHARKILCSDQEIAVEFQEIYLNKVAKRVKDYEVKILNELRPGKKLLVLDIDYTLFDHRTTAQSGWDPHINLQSN